MTFVVFLRERKLGAGQHHDHEMGEQTNAFNRQLEALGNVERSIGEQLIQLKAQNQELNRLGGSLSTYRKGSFPDYLMEIGKLAETASHLDILVDCLDFGSFFEPKFHNDVHFSICGASNRGVRTRILVCGYVPEPFTGPSGQALSKYKTADELLGAYCKMLTGDGGFVDWIKEKLGSPEGQAFKTFAATWFRTPDPGLVAPLAGSDLPTIQADPILEATQRDMHFATILADPERARTLLSDCLDVCLGKRVPSAKPEDGPLLTTLLQIRQLWFARDLQRFGVKIRTLAQPEPMFFWIKYKNEEPDRRDIQDDDALFTFAKASRGPGQLGYTTHDPDLLNTFRATFEEKWAEADAQKAGAERPWLAFLRTQ